MAWRTSSTIAVNANLLIDGPGTFNFGGFLTGPGNLTFQGGNRSITGAGLNNFSGTTTVSEGRLNLNRVAGATAVRGPLIVGDGAVGFADLVAVAQHYDTVGSGSWFNGDFDYDGNVGFSDLVAVA